MLGLLFLCTHSSCMSSISPPAPLNLHSEAVLCEEFEARKLSEEVLPFVSSCYDSTFLFSLKFDRKRTNKLGRLRTLSCTFCRDFSRVSVTFFWRSLCARFIFLYLSQRSSPFLLLFPSKFWSFWRLLFEHFNLWVDFWHFLKSTYAIFHWDYRRTSIRV